MYYACAMTKRAGRISKRLIVIIVGVLVLAGLGVGGYFGYQRWRAHTKAGSEQAKVVAAKLPYAGDQDLAGRYITLVQSKHVAQAQQLFIDRVKSEKNVQKKIDLYTQNVNLALSLKNTDAALDAAKRMVEVRSSHDTYAQLATVYIARSEPAPEIDVLQKAIITLDAEKDVANRDQLKLMYQSQLDAAKRQQAIMEKYGK